MTKSRNHILPLLLATVMIMLACNLPSTSQGGGVSLTAAAQTVEAFLSSTPGGASTAASTHNPGTPATAIATLTALNTPAVPNTAIASATSNCNQMDFVTDVTIPDGTIIAPGTGFTKTWRLRNTGTCPWTPSYFVVFSDGNSMNGPSSQALPGTVNPGQTVDISINMTAPAAPGEYRGNWKLRDASGVLFGRFYVEIKSQNTAVPNTPVPLPPAIAQVTLSSLSGESGQVRSDGTVLTPPNTGDTDSNTVIEAFVSFDISAIPSGATITKVVVDFSSYDVLGNPWGLGDGCVRAYVQNFESLDAGDFYPGDPLGATTKWCGAGELSSTFEDSDMKSVVQSAVGSSRLQFRIQFRTPTTDNDGVADVIRFGTVKLIVTYQ